MCHTMKMEASKSAGSPLTIFLKASKPPADAPMTMMLRLEDRRAGGAQVGAADYFPNAALCGTEEKSVRARLLVLFHPSPTAQKTTSRQSGVRHCRDGFKGGGGGGK